MEQKTIRFEMRLTPTLDALIDEWRRGQPDIPPRAEAVRRLMEAGLKARSAAPRKRVVSK